LSQPPQVVLAPMIMLKSNSNDDNWELNIEIPKEVCPCIDQNLNEDHDIEQNSESDQYVRMSTKNKKIT